MSATAPVDEGVPLFSKEEWNARAAQVAREMKEFPKKFVTPISIVIDENYGEPWGTGNYVELLRRPHILTNEHVARALTSHSFGHQFLDNENVYRATNPFHTHELPLDVAVSSVEDKVWNDRPHGSAAIPEKKWALAHAPLAREILFVKGFAGVQAKFVFGTLLSHATSYGCQEVPLPPDDRYHSRFHFGLDYRPDLATELDRRSLPDPHGLSGSLVWDTRFVECSVKKETWTPESARIIGLVWGWPTSAAFLVATRVEYVRTFLLRFLEQ